MTESRQSAGVTPSGSGHSPKGGAASASPAKPSVPNAAWLRDNLTRQEASAFLALFAGGRRCLKAFRREADAMEMPVSFGKAECEWVPFRQTWQDRFPALGLTTFVESAPKPALGMNPGWVFTEIHIGVTDFGWAAREAFWERVNDASAIDARSAETGDTDSARKGESAGPKDDAPVQP